MASVVPKPAIIPAVATVPRKTPPAKKSLRNKNQDIFFFLRAENQNQTCFENKTWKIKICQHMLKGKDKLSTLFTVTQYGKQVRIFWNTAFWKSIASVCIFKPGKQQKKSLKS